MENPKQEIINNLKKILEQMGLKNVEPKLSFPQNDKHGDYSSNIAMAIFSRSKITRSASSGQKSKIDSPLEMASEIVKTFNSQLSILNFLEKAEVAPPGFINFWLSEEFLIGKMEKVIEEPEKIIAKAQVLKKIMVEYAHPNTHKEMHIGHMRTLITGEALARLFEATGNKVFRANYQGDVGPHVAKAIFGLKKIIKDENLSLEEINKWKNIDKAEILGRGYVLGNKEYEANKDEIDKINSQLYEIAENSKGRFTPGVFSLSNLYEITRKWSLDYYDDFYKRFYTKFDCLFFESEVSGCGKRIVEEQVGKIFEKDDGAIVFKGGHHTRVFITAQGYPTYEGKEMCLGFKEYAAFPFDKNVHVVGSEQAGYFKVVFKALELLDPEKFKDKEYHLSMGMVNIIGMKISSRTGEILRVDSLIEKVKEKVSRLVDEGKISASDLEKTIEEIAIGAIKYSVLRVGTGQNVEFDIEKSVSLDGNSGPYLQYTYARTRSVLAKAGCHSDPELVEGEESHYKPAGDPSVALLPQAFGSEAQARRDDITNEELSLLRTIYRFPEVVEDSARNMAPNALTNYLFDLAQKFNLFYQKHQILLPQERSTPGESCPSTSLRAATPGVSSSRQFRLALTQAVGQIIKNGLNLLGIEAPDKM